MCDAQSTFMMQNCLVIQPGAVGDCILTAPLIRMLADLGPVDVMGHTERLAVLEGRTQINRILSLEVPGLHQLFADDDGEASSESLVELLSGYQLIVTFLADEKGVFQRNLARLARAESKVEVVSVELRPPSDWPGHAAEFFVEQVRDQFPGYEFAGWDILHKGPLLQATDDDEEKGWAMLAQANVHPQGGNVVAIHPGSGGAKKCWPVENFRQVARELIGRGCQVVMLLGPAEMERWPGETIAQVQAEMPIICDASIADIAAMLSCCAVYLGNDSGITHLAGALDRDTIAIFGPSSSLHWRPLGAKVWVIEVASDAWPDTEMVLGEIERAMRPE